MKMVIIFGPGAVGKMTVGQELAKMTGLPLLHNHLSIEFLLPFFEHGSPSFARLDTLIRKELVRELAKNKGLIFTFVWALDDPKDKAYAEMLWQEASTNIEDICFVELYSDQQTRLKRNGSENRLKEKPSKRDREWSDKDLKSMDSGYRLNSDSKNLFFYPTRHLRIDNTNLEAKECAAMIRNHFQLV